MENIGQERSAHQLLTEPMPNQYHITQIMFAFAISIGMIYMSFRNYLLFHSLIELFSIIIAFMMFAIAINTGRFIGPQSRLISLLGISFGIVGFFDLLHTLAFKGMGVFPGSTANLPTELWIASRYFQSVALLVTGIFIDKQVKTKRILLFYISVSLALFASIFIFDVFPDCYIEGYGLTDFKKISEVIISLIFFAGAILLFMKRKALKVKTFWLLMISVFFTIVSEIVFIFYVDVYGLSNMIGHMTKLVAFYLIYKAIVEVSLLHPVIELTRSEKKYADLIESLPESIVIVKDKGIVFANTAAIRLFGEEGLKENFANLSGDGPVIFQNNHGPLQERQILRPDESFMSVEIKTLPFIHQDEQSTMAIINDVTERRSAERVARRNADLQLEAEILHKNEKEYLEIINGSTEASWIFDFENRTLSYSHEWKQRIGGEHVSDQDMDHFAMALVHPDDLESAIQQRKSIFGRKLTKYTCEYRLKINTGEYIWVYDQGKIVYNDTGAPAKIYGTSMDISKRKQIEQDLREALHEKDKSARELSAVIASIPDGLVIYNRCGNPVFFNEPAKHFFTQFQIEYQKDFSTRVEEATLFSEDGTLLKKEEWPISRVFSTGEIVRDFVIMRPRKTESALFTSATCAPILDPDGTITGAVALLKDISEQKHADALLHESEQNAKHLVSQLQDADRNKNRFISVLSHEIRNPLAAIVMSLALLDHGARNEQQVQKAKDIMNRQAAQLTHLVEDLLDVTRISENKITLKKEKIDILDIIHRNVADFQAAFDEKGVLLIATLPEAPVVLDIDSVRMTQAIGNLLHNALKFTRKSDQVEISVRTDKPKQEALIIVSDTGSGIDQETLQNLFSPFVQSDRSLARTQGGLGLGLSIVKGIVELLGGTIEAQSEGIGQGATFVIHLPLIEALL